MTSCSPSEFDGGALIRALDAQRADTGLLGAPSRTSCGNSLLTSMPGWRPRDVPGALVRTAKRETMSCQYALTLLRWIGARRRTSRGAVVDVGDVRLPEAGSDNRLRWISARHAALTSAATNAGSPGRKCGRIQLHAKQVDQPQDRPARRHGQVMGITQCSDSAARFVHPPSGDEGSEHRP